MSLLLVAAASESIPVVRLQAQLFSYGRPISIHINVILCKAVAFLGRLPKVDLIILERGENVRPYVRTSVRTSTKSFFDLNEIWYVGRGR